MYFKNFHRACWSRKTPRPKGPWRRAREVPSLLPELRVFWRSRQDAVAAGSGGSPRSLTPGPCLPPPLAKQQQGTLLSQDRPEQLLRLRPWKYISSTRRRHLRSDPSPGSTRLPPLEFGVWVFPAQIHSRVRPRSGLPRSEIIQTFCERISPSRAYGPEPCSRGAPEA